MLESSDERALPSVDTLYKRYVSYNETYFDGCLPPAEKVTIQWSRRLTASAGLCQPVTRTIRLSVHYHVKFPDEVNNTLLHEMIHLIVPNHGRQFYAWMERIRKRGGYVTRHAKERATPDVFRWEYSCLACNLSKKTRRRYARGGASYRCRLCKGKLTEKRLPTT